MKKAILILVVAVVVGVMAVGLGALARFEFDSPSKTCVLCHEIKGSQERVATSPHKDVDCKACHGGTLEALGTTSSGSPVMRREQTSPSLRTSSAFRSVRWRR